MQLSKSIESAWEMLTYEHEILKDIKGKLLCSRIKQLWVVQAGDFLVFKRP